MNNIYEFLIFFALICGLAGFMALRVHITMSAYLELRRRRKEFPYVESASENNICRDPHKWDKTKLALGALPVDNYLVCTECGLISTEGDYKLNGPALTVFKNNLERRKRRQAHWDMVFKKKQEVTHEIMNKMIKAHVEQLGSDLHANIEVLQQFFRKSNAELENLYASLNKDIDEEDSRG